MRRLILIVLAIVAALCLAAGAAVYWLLSGDAIRQALETQASAWLGEPVHIAAAHAQLFPRVGIDLSDVRVGEPARVTFASVSVSAPLRPLLSRRVEDAAITVSHSRIEMPLPFTMPTAGQPGDSAVPGARIQLLSIRSIALRDVAISSRGHTITLDADSSLAGSELMLERFTAVSGRTQLDAAGVVALDPRVDAGLAVKAKLLDLDELMALANAFAPSGGQSTSRQSSSGRLPVRIAARVTADNATVDSLQAHQLVTNLEVDGDSVSLAPLSFQMFGGRYDGSVTARLGRTLTATLRAQLQRIDVGQLAAFGGVPGAINGTLAGNGSFSGAGADFAGVLRSARGTGALSIVNGTIEHLDLIRTVVLFFGRPAPNAAPSSDRFDRIDARYSLAQQVLRADALSLHSGDADIVGNGTFNTATKALDGMFNLSLSEALSQQAGTDLFRYTHEGNRIVLPAKLGGTAGHPRLTIDAAAAVQRGLKNEIQRRLGGFLDRLNGKP
jgi:hypothetical protein